MKYIASCSNGKDSLAMILKLIEENCPLDEVIFFDSGKEFEAIYNTWKQLKEILDLNNVKYTVLKPKFDFDYAFSEKPIKTRNGENKHGYSWCGGLTRWMTRLKLEEIKKHYDENYPNETIVEYIGLACDELSRVDFKRSNRTVKKYPLIEWGMTENDCFCYCYKHGFDWREGDISLYQVLDRVSCWCCGNKNLKELESIYRNLPEYWEKLKQMQDKTYRPINKSGSIYELEERFKSKDSKVKQNDN